MASFCHCDVDAERRRRERGVRHGTTMLWGITRQVVPRPLQRRYLCGERNDALSSGVGYGMVKVRADDIAPRSRR